MNLPTVNNDSPEPNHQTWNELKQIIASSSGFEKWQRSRVFENQTLDQLVTHYLRETLETLAY
jgi:hypothetical protein